MTFQASSVSSTFALKDLQQDVLFLGGAGGRGREQGAGVAGGGKNDAKHQTSDNGRTYPPTAPRSVDRSQARGFGH